MLSVVGGVGMLSVGLIHFIDVFDMWDQSKYMAGLFATLIVGSLVATALLATGRHRAGWSLGGALALGAIIGFVVSRSAGVPQLSDDIGNWREPLGLAALFVESLVVTVSASGLLTLSSPSQARASLPAPARSQTVGV